MESTLLSIMNSVLSNDICHLRQFLSSIFQSRFPDWCIIK
ncbi:unnamed protein product [Schistosoma curassoni]|uniref:Uncharacterized protein n=1 Tax=Schistosoma curassoni TaxID=6186 RepID=A0A183K475_9TREM|nr:unnamed protein product [Schistosoma curassoni]